MSPVNKSPSQKSLLVEWALSVLLFAFISMLFYLLVVRAFWRPNGPVVLDHVDAILPLDSGKCAVVLGMSKQFQIVDSDGRIEFFANLGGISGPFKLKAARSNGQIIVEVTTLKTASNIQPVRYILDQRPDGASDHVAVVQGIPMFQTVHFGVSGQKDSRVKYGVEPSCRSYPLVSLAWFGGCVVCGTAFAYSRAKRRESHRSSGEQFPLSS